MRRSLRPLSAALVLSFAAAAAPQPSDVDRWWAHVAYLADDAMQGRQTGSREHRAAAEYVAAQFRKAGLEPGAGDGYLQPVGLVTRTVDEARSRISLLRDGRELRVVLGEHAMLNARIQQPPQLTAPLVFAGYGLTIPEVGYDDLAGLDVNGKVVVYLAGSPPGVSAPLYGYYASVRSRALQAAGAAGTVAIQNPQGQDVPWERQMQNRLIPQMALAVPGSDDAGQQLAVVLNPRHAEGWFEGSGHTFDEILGLADAGRPLPRMPLPGTLRASVAMTGEPVTSENVVGLRRGTHPVLRNEYVVLTAHLDHLGTGQPVDGDAIFNGAMDNASGIATLIETAAALGTVKELKRSLAFVAVTAEEKGLLGSRYFAERPTIASGRIVANLNTDMFLPLFPFESVVAQGLEESDLAADLRRVAASVGVAVLGDPEPERNAFTRSDQYSFIRRGVPALSLKVGYTRDSPAHETLKAWRATRYHAVTDDLSQPVDKEAAVKFNRLYVQLVEAVANRPTRPQWHADSFFRRFAVPTSD